ncbi:MAG: hypothetical protein WCP55_21170 [Lentisphaerota bacterium]
MNSKLLLTIMVSLLLTALVMTNSNSAYAEQERVDITLRFAPALEEMGDLNFKAITSGRTVRRTIVLDDPYVVDFYSGFTLVNYIFIDRVLLNVTFYEKGNARFYRSLNLIVDEETIRNKMRNNKLLIIKLSIIKRSLINSGLCNQI